MVYRVENATAYNNAPAFKVVEYQGAGVNFPVESKKTLDAAQAAEWAAKANAGEEVPEAGFASFSDD